MPLRTDELAKTVDQTVLDPNASPADVEAAARRARELHLASLCVLPRFVAAAAEELRGSDVKVCCVIGHPDGASPSREKTRAAEVALADGAGELELVLDIAALRRADVRGIRDDLVGFTRTMRMRVANGGRGAIVLKAVLGTPVLDDKLIRLASRMVERAEVDFAQTTTDESVAPALAEVELLRESLPESIGVKAVGSLETVAELQDLVVGGAARVGSPTAADLLNDAALVRA